MVIAHDYAIECGSESPLNQWLRGDVNDLRSAAGASCGCGHQTGGDCVVQ
jgi:hypothetical protein